MSLLLLINTILVAIGIVNMSTAFDLLRQLINDDFLVFLRILSDDSSEFFVMEAYGVDE